MSQSKRVQNTLSAIRCGLINEVEIAITTQVFSPCEELDLLCCAIKYDKQRIVDLLLYYGFKVSSQETRAESPLHLAVDLGNIPIVKNLLNNKAPINAQDRTGSTPLILAVKKNNIAMVKALVCRGASVDTCDNNNLSPIHYAVTKNVELVSELIKYGASIDKKCDGNNTSLHLAVQSGELEIVKFLISKGAQANALNDKDESPFHLALQNKSAEIAYYLINSGSFRCVKQQNSSGESVLYLAVKKDYCHLVKILLDKNVEVDTTTFSNITPIYEAVANENEMICDLLLEFKANVNISDQNGKTPLLLAVERDNFLIAKMLLENKANVDAKAKDEICPLFVAARSGNEQLFQLLLLYNPKKWSDAFEKETKVILHRAVNRGIFCIVHFVLKHFKFRNSHFNNLLKSALLGSIQNADPILNLFIENGFRFSKEVIYDLKIVNLVIEKGLTEIFKDLLNNGLDVNTITEFERGGRIFRYSLLNFAIYKKQKNIATMLIEHGASLDMIDNSSPPLFYALSSYFTALNSENIEFFEVFLKNDVDLYMKNGLGRTALHEIISAGPELDFVKLFLEYGAEVNCVDRENLSPLHFAERYDLAQLLLENGAAVDHKSALGQTPLHKAAYRSVLKTVQVLINYHADTNAQDKDGNTPLHLTTNEDIAQVLLENNADPNIKNKNGFSPFFNIVLIGKTSIIKMFLKYNANPQWKETGSTLLHLANSDDVIELLIQEGTNFDDKNDQGLTPFFKAVVGGNFKIIELLSSYDADVNKKYDDSLSPIHFAFQKSKTKLFQHLLDNNLNIDIYEEFLAVIVVHTEQNLPNTNRKKRMIEMLQQYIVKLKTAGLHVNKTCEKVPMDKFSPTFEQTCESELENLKTQNIGDSSISLFDVLTADSARLVSFFKINGFENAFDEVTFEKKHPIYFSVLKFKFNRARKRRDLINRFQAVPNKIAYLPDLCVDKIISYLTNKDLVNLVFKVYNSVEFT